MMIMVVIGRHPRRDGGSYVCYRALRSESAACPGSNTYDPPSRHRLLGGKWPSTTWSMFPVESTPDISTRLRSPFHVLSGIGVWQEEGKPPITLRAGDSLLVPAGTIHSHWNPSSTERLRFLEFIVAEKDKGRSIPRPLKD